MINHEFMENLRIKNVMWWNRSLTKNILNDVIDIFEFRWVKIWFRILFFNFVRCFLIKSLHYIFKSNHSGVPISLPSECWMRKKIYLSFQMYCMSSFVDFIQKDFQFHVFFLCKANSLHQPIHELVFCFLFSFPIYFFIPLQ